MVRESGNVATTEATASFGWNTYASSSGSFSRTTMLYCRSLLEKILPVSNAKPLSHYASEWLTGMPKQDTPSGAATKPPQACSRMRRSLSPILTQLTTKVRSTWRRMLSFKVGFSVVGCCVTERVNKAPGCRSVSSFLSCHFHRRAQWQETVAVSHRLALAEEMGPEAHTGSAR